MDKISDILNLYKIAVFTAFGLTSKMLDCLYLFDIFIVKILKIHFAFQI